jgi:TonB family protein
VKASHSVLLWLLLGTSCLNCNAATPPIPAEVKKTGANLASTVDPKWKDHGAYLQRLIDKVQIEWERLTAGQTHNPRAGAAVTVRFVLNHQGRIIDIAAVKSSANEAATRACVSAITNRMPYGPWTDDMRAVLGERQEMTFTFHYQ